MEVVFGSLVLATKRVEAYEEVLASIDSTRPMHTYLPATLWPSNGPDAQRVDEDSLRGPERDAPRPNIADAIEAKKKQMHIE